MVSGSPGRLGAPWSWRRVEKTWRHLRAARGPKLCPGGGEEDFDKDPSISGVGWPVLSEDKEFLQQCVDNCGLALVPGLHRRPQHEGARGPHHWHKEHTAQSARTRRRRSRNSVL